MSQWLEKIADKVSEEFQMSGLSSGIYGDFTSEVAKRYAIQIVSQMVKENQDSLLRVCEMVERARVLTEQDSL